MREQTEPVEQRAGEPDDRALTERVRILDDTIAAVRPGGIDAVVTGPEGAKRIYALTGVERPYRLLVENMAQGAAILSESGIVMYANRRLGEMVGEHDLVGRDLAGLLVPDDRAALSAVTWMGDGEMVTAACRLATRYGAHPVMLSVRCIETEGVRVRALFASDRDAPKAAGDELDVLVAARTRDLTDANIRLEATKQELETFTHSIANELGTPLRAITGFADALIEDDRGQLTPEQRRLAGVIISNAARMKGLIDALVRLAEAGRIPIPTSLVDMTSLVEGVANQIHEREPERALTISIAPLRPMACNKAAIARVWMDLLDRPRRSSPGDPVSIDISCEERDEDVVFRVSYLAAGSDDGEVFAAFDTSRSAHGTKVLDGSDIGLAAARRTVERHGGVVGSDAGERGFTLWFTLPKVRDRDG